MVLDYQSETGPRLRCRFSMGEYNGRPNYLLKSPHGLLWNNLPPDLEALVKMPNMDSAIRNFALGPRGLYWYTYQSVKDVIEQRGSSNVWSVLSEDWKGGCPLRVTFGSDGYFWGEKEWMVNGGHLVQVFGTQPPSLSSECARLYPNLKSFEINFVALGMRGCWVVGTTIGAAPIWSGINKTLKETLEREVAAGHVVHNVVLSTVRDDLYWIEYADGSIDFSLPSDWDLRTIGSHIQRHVNSNKRSPHDLAPSLGPSYPTTLSRLWPTDPLYTFVHDLFRKGWRHPQKQPIPQVHQIYEVVLSESLSSSYLNYLERIELSRRHVVSGLPRGNQSFGWHGTRRTCGVGDNPSSLDFCTSTACPTCLILRGSFDIRQAGHAPGRAFLRFGHAIYTSSCSSKSDDYQVSSNSGYRSLILARVVKGKSKKLTKGDKTIWQAPAGFDSVEGIVGEELNYDETCLYNRDAVRPAFLILYR